MAGFRFAIYEIDEGDSECRLENVEREWLDGPVGVFGDDGFRVAGFG